eukprot:Hpha_TRINITY_DN15770_c2_g2::TRINITY_DN15770_c2_g2_i1::g.41292::m.41292/K03679/RRP4, EXOSC2; exosome complex component RRP4
MDNTELVVPGDVITAQSRAWLHGKGTYERAVGEGEEKGETDEGELSKYKLVASTCGRVVSDARLVRVVPPKGRYVGSPGDCVIGRVIEVGAGRWRVNVGAHLDATILISNVNLPGGTLRRKSREDVKQMRSFFQEGDLLSAEVQKINRDGGISLHTRSARYGKLPKGIMVEVPSLLVRRLRTHFHNFDFGVSAVIGVNGSVFLHKTPKGGYGDKPTGGGGDDDESEETKMTKRDLHAGGGELEEKTEIVHLPPTREDRLAIARLRAALLLLGAARVEVSPLTMLDVYRTSIAEGISPPEMLHEEKAEALLSLARMRSRTGKTGGEKRPREDDIED